MIFLDETKDPVNISKLKDVLHYDWKENFRIRNDCETERIKENLKMVSAFYEAMNVCPEFIFMFHKYLDRKRKQR